MTNIDRINTDSCFVGSKLPKTCEDYATHESSCVVISDGCSSSLKTDYGARLLVQAALLARVEGFSVDGEWIGSHIIRHADLMRACLDLPIHCLDATLMIADVIDNQVCWHVWGDGVVAIKRTTDKVPTIYEIEYAKNMPYYLRYERYGKIDYLCEMVGQVSPKIITISGTTKIEDDVCMPTSGCIPIDDLDWLCLMSDGVCSFSNNEVSITVPEVVAMLTDFKNRNGKFAQRRLHRVVSHYAGLGFVNHDDVSMACIVTP